MLNFCRRNVQARTYFRWSDGQKYVWVRRLLSSKLAVQIGEKSPRWRRETESSEIRSDVLSLALICSRQIRSSTFMDAARITVVQYYISPIYRILIIEKSAFQLSEKLRCYVGHCPVQSKQMRQSNERAIGNSVPQAQAPNAGHWRMRNQNAVVI